MKDQRYLVFTAMGFELLGIILSAIYVGQIIDEKYNLKGLAMVFLSMCGLGGWIFHIVVLAKKISTKSEQDPKL